MTYGHSLKYSRFTLLGCKDIGIRKFEFLSKTQILYIENENYFQPIFIERIMFFMLSREDRKIEDLKTFYSKGFLLQNCCENTL